MTSQEEAETAFTTLTAISGGVDPANVTEYVAMSDEEKAAKLRQLGGVGFGFGDKLEFHSSATMDQIEVDGEDDVFEQEMLKQAKKTEEAERKRWEQDEKEREMKELLELEFAQEKEKRDRDQKDRIAAELINNPNRSIITNVEDIDPNGNQGNNIVVTPQPPKPTGTIPKKLKSTKKSRSKVNTEDDTEVDMGNVTVNLQEPDSQMSQISLVSESRMETQPMPEVMEAAAPLVARSIAKLSQSHIPDFMSRRSSTLADSQICLDDDDEESERSFHSAPEDNDTDKTLPIDETLQKLSRHLSFSDVNYQLLTVTPSGASRKVTVPVRKDKGVVTQPKSKLPIMDRSTLSQTLAQEKVNRRKALINRWRTNSESSVPTKPSSSSSIVMTEPKKRVETAETMIQSTRAPGSSLQRLTSNRQKRIVRERVRLTRMRIQPPRRLNQPQRRLRLTRRDRMWTKMLPRRKTSRPKVMI